MIQEWLLFKGSKLCIPRCSMREKILKETYSGVLARHFGKDKTFSQLSAFYFYLGMQNDVKKFVERCIFCQYAKGKRHNIGLYQPFPIPD
jgi:hypothetical protein